LKESSSEIVFKRYALLSPFISLTASPNITRRPP
jgi:hypothetical protein